jgi:putative transposase
MGWIWNLCLEQRQLAWNSSQRKSLSGVDQMGRELTTLKRDPEAAWMYEIPSQLWQQKIGDLQTAFERFWDGTGDFPQWKRQKDRRGSVRFPSPKDFKVTETIGRKGSSKRVAGIAHVTLPKIGRLAFRQSREIDGVVKSATISRDGSQWWISFAVESEIVVSPKKLNAESVVGYDRGVTNNIATSEGEIAQLPESIKRLEREVERMQRLNSRKQRGSANQKKVLAKISKVQRQIKNIRHDELLSNETLNDTFFKDLISILNKNKKSIRKFDKIADINKELNDLKQLIINP